MPGIGVVRVLTVRTLFPKNNANHYRPNWFVPDPENAVPPIIDQAGGQCTSYTWTVPVVGANCDHPNGRASMTRSLLSISPLIHHHR